MKYPINTERYIAAIRKEFGPNEAAEMVHLEIVPLLNTAYQDGRAGAAGYPMDPAAEIAKYEAERGPMSNRCKQFCTAFTRCLNAAYAQGLKDSDSCQ